MSLSRRALVALLPAVAGVAVAAFAMVSGGPAAPVLRLRIALLAVVLGGLALAVSWRLARRLLHPAATRTGAPDRGAPVSSSAASGAAACPSVPTDPGAPADRGAGDGALIDDVVRELGNSLRDVQLPLHILLSSPFGALNENQEEMLGAAQGAVDAADRRLRLVQQLRSLESGTVTVASESIDIADLLRPVMAIGAARAAEARVQLRATIAPDAPRAVADVLRAREALTILVSRVIAHSAAGSDVRLDARVDRGGDVCVEIGAQRAITEEPADEMAGATQRGVAPPGSDDVLEIRLASRLVALQRGSLIAGSTACGERYTVCFPCPNPASTRATG